MKTFFSALTGFFCLFGFFAEMIYAAEPVLPEISQDISSPAAESIRKQDLQLPSQVPPLRQLKDPGTATLLSSIVPGLGHVYLDDMKTASALMGAAVCGAGLYFSPATRNPSVRGFVFSTFLATSFYSVYAAYRDTRLYNGVSQYTYSMPMDSLADLTYAPFKWSVIKKPEVWGGVLGALGLASIVYAVAHPRGTEKIHKNLAASTYHHLPIRALPVGVGEEAYFRGYLQSALSENWGPTAGIAVSSIFFGAAHFQNAQYLRKSDRWRYYTFSMPLIATIGAYLGWLTQKNRSMQESVAIHTWYDAIVFSLDFLYDYKASIATPKEFTVSIPF